MTENTATDSLPLSWLRTTHSYPLPSSMFSWWCVRLRQTHQPRYYPLLFSLSLLSLFHPVLPSSLFRQEFLSLTAWHLCVDKNDRRLFLGDAFHIFLGIPYCISDTSFACIFIAHVKVGHPSHFQRKNERMTTTKVSKRQASFGQRKLAFQIMIW